MVNLTLSHKNGSVWLRVCVKFSDKSRKGLQWRNSLAKLQISNSLFPVVISEIFVMIWFAFIIPFISIFLNPMFLDLFWSIYFISS